MAGHPDPVRLAAARRGLAVAAVGLLGGCAVLAWMTLQASLGFLQVVWHGLAGEFLPGASLPTYVAQFRTLRHLQGLAWLLTAAGFLAWLSRARLSAALLGGGRLRYSLRDAMAGFLVPPVNLVRPVQVLGEIWQASGPPGVARGGAPGASGRAVISTWWGLVLGAAGVEIAVVIASGAQPGVGREMLLLMIGQLLTVAAAVLGIAVVARVEGRQRERPARLDGTDGT